MTRIPSGENEKLLVRGQPLTDQVFEILKERITNGVIQSGDQLPTESQLAKELKVSRSTVRAAISRLEDRKLVQRRQGVGTYLRVLASMPNPLNEFVELCQLIRATGNEPGYSTFSEIVRPDESVAGALQLRADALVLKQRKIFTANGDPFIYVLNYIPVWIFENVISHEEALRPDLTERFIDFFEITCGQKLSHFVTTVKADIYENIDPPGELINDGPHTPVLEIIETGFNEEDQPVVQSLEFHPGNWMSFKLIRHVSKRK